MKQFILFLVAISLVAVVTYGFKKMAVPDHKYSLTLTETQWQAHLRFIESAKVVMLKSSYPAQEVSALSDSLTLFENQIQNQIGSQVRADTLRKK